MYYRNLIMIHDCSKMLLKMKNSYNFLNTYSILYTIMKKQWLERTPNVIPFLNLVFSHRLGPFTLHRWAEDGLTECCD